MNEPEQNAGTDKERVRCMKLIDALCVLHCGWTDENAALYAEARKLVWTHAKRLNLRRQLDDIGESASIVPISEGGPVARPNTD